MRANCRRQNPPWRSPGSAGHLARIGRVDPLSRRRPLTLEPELLREHETAVERLTGDGATD